jgi:hypothetical protein
MGQLTQTTTELQAIVDNSDAANVGKTSLTDGSDTTAVAFKKSGFYSLQGSSSNAPSTDRAVLISAIRDTAATGEIRYGQIAITESNGLWWNRDDGGSLGTWYAAVSTTGTQTLTNKTLTSPVLTTPQINDSAADHQYIFAGSNLVADRTVTLPLLASDDTFVFEAHTQTLTNKTLTSPVFNTGVSGTAVLDADDFTGASATTLATSESIKAYVDSQVGSFDTLSEVLAAGNTTGSTDIEVTAAQKVQFRDAAIYINSSADGQLDIVADTEIQIAATTIDVNGTLAFDSLKGTGATTVTNILDEDNMASDSATAIATQQSIKAYVDSQVGTVDTLSEILANGNTTGSTDIAVDSAQKVQFRDAAIYINSSADGQLDIVADTEIQIAATTVDLNGNLDVSGTLGVTGVATLASLVATTADINAGTIDNTVIGGTTAAAGSFTTGSFSETTFVGLTARPAGVPATAGRLWAAQNETGNYGIASKASTTDSFTYIGNTGTKATLGQSYGSTGSYLPLVLQTSDIDRLTISAAGAATFSAGITATTGTFSSGQAILTVSSSTTSAGNAAEIKLIHAGNNTYEIKGGSDLIFSSDDGANERVRITNAGDVGIGSSPAGYRLLVESGANSATAYFSSTATPAYNPVAYNGGTARLAFVGGNATGATTGINFSHGGSVENYFGAVQEAGGAGAFVWQGYSGSVYAERMRLDASGSLGINNSNPSAFDSLGSKHLVVGNGVNTSNLTLFSDDTADANGYGHVAFADSAVSSSTAQYAGLIQYYHGEDSMRFYTNATEKMRLDTSGNLLVGTTSQGYGLFSSSRVTLGDGDAGDGFCVGGINENLSAYTVQADNDTGTRYFAYIANGSSSVVGTISFTSSGTGYNTSSDQRLKENIEDADDAGSKIDAIQVRKFDWKVDGSHQDYGMVAQELQVVAPEAVSAPEDPEEMMGVDYSKLVPMMLKEIQSLRARINALEAE